MADQSGFSRGFIRSDRAWYASANALTHPQVIFGLLYPDGGFEFGEAVMNWVVVGDELAARLEMFQDAFPLLVACPDVFTGLSALAGDDPVGALSITDDEFVALLQSCGFVDFTAYSR